PGAPSVVCLVCLILGVVASIASLTVQYRSLTGILTLTAGRRTFKWSALLLAICASNPSASTFECACPSSPMLAREVSIFAVGGWRFRPGHIYHCKAQQLSSGT